MPWVMALVRLTAGWLVCRGPLTVLVVAPAAYIQNVAGPASAWALAALLALGILAFAWPGSYLAGAVCLAVGLGTFDWLWQRGGLASGPLAGSLGIVAVLALGEWLTRLVRRRYSES
jgi:hypothetical protein